MSFFEKNKAVLDAVFPHFLEKLKEMEENAEKREIRLEKSLSGDPSLMVDGVYVHSRHNPAREAARLAAEMLPDSEAVIIILGFGLGYIADALGEKGEKKRKIVIVEKHPAIFKKALENRDFSRFFSENTVALVIGDEDFSSLVSCLSFFESKETALVKNRALIGLDAEWYAGAEQRISAWKNKNAVNSATLKRFGTRWTRNVLKNKDFIYQYPGVLRLKNALDRKFPVLLAAAGPSLDALAPFLTDLAERCVMVSADTSLNFLKKAGVDPDWIVSGDPQYWNTRHLDYLGQSNAGLISECSIYPLTFHRKGEKIFLFSSAVPLARFLEDAVDPKGFLGSGGSVATTAFDFCLALNPAALFIAGLDLSFPHYKTHFKDAFFEKQANSQANRFCPAETRSFKALRDGFPFYAPSANGGKVLTDKRLSLYAAWFENRLRSIDQAETPLFSLSDEGIAIEGLKTTDIERVLALPSRRIEINALFSKLFSKINDDFSHNQAERFEKYRAAHKTIAKNLKEIALCLEKGEQNGKNSSLTENPLKSAVDFFHSGNFAQNGASYAESLQFLTGFF